VVRQESAGNTGRRHMALMADGLSGKAAGWVKVRVADVNVDRVNRLFDGWYGALVSYASRLTSSSVFAEDVVQEAFYLLYRELAAGKAIANEKAWTFCVVRREIGRQVYRRRRREVSLDSPEVRRAEAAEAGEPDREHWAELFALLSPREEEVLLLSMETLRYKEIGAVMGISHNTVATMHRRAIRKLRLFLGLDVRGKGAPVCGDTAPIRNS
jgi:RNA polymerase sigma factor (sigma-70 family)